MNPKPEKGLKDGIDINRTAAFESFKAAVQFTIRF